MIGTIRFVDDGQLMVATLMADGRWVCPASGDVAERLNSDYSPIGVLEGHVNWGHCQLIAAARSLNGRAWFPPGTRDPGPAVSPRFRIAPLDIRKFAGSA